MKVTVTKNLNVRIGKPSLNALNYEFLKPGSVIETDGKLYRGEVFEGNNYWYKDAAGNYYWSGGVEAPQTEINKTFSNSTVFIDFHCHSILKPYSKSFKRKKTLGKNTINSRKKRSVWYKTELNILKKIANALLTTTKFTQADFTSALEGGAKVIMVSIDPMERELVLSKERETKNPKGRLLLDFVQGIGKRRMKYLEKLQNYFADLEQSYRYLDKLQNTQIKIKNKKVTYRIVDTYEDFDFMSEGILYIIPTMEGGHVFRSDISTNLTASQIETQVLNNIDIVKSTWKITPFFVSLAHHFKNGLCGQAKSLTGIANLAFEQYVDPELGLEPLGRKVIDVLLSRENGKKRILIDVKHMNLKSRKAYYCYVLEKNKDASDTEKISIVVSHGATNNLPWPDKEDSEINFYKEEIPIIAQTGGIFGVQLDARRLREAEYGNKRRGLNLTIERRGLYKRAFFVWRQVEMMARYIYNEREVNGEFEDIDPWGFQVIGSDFDGVVDPLDGYWTHSEMPLLREYLILQAEAFLKTKKAKALPDYEELDAEELVEKFMVRNARDFLEEHFSKAKRSIL